MDNAFAGWPAALRGEAWFEAVITCGGEIDPRAGYLIDIKEIDRVVRQTLVPAAVTMQSTVTPNPNSVLRESLGPMQEALRGLLQSVRWKLTPYYSLEMTMPHSDRVLMRQRFDFAASHRLFVPGLSDAENAALFGKCSRVNGHGHNYQFEPCIEVPLDQAGHSEFSLARLESLVAGLLLERFDHTHLNLDCPEFSQPGGLNPTVENIARVFYKILAPAVRSNGAGLRSMTVWETDRTSAEYGE